MEEDIKILEGFIEENKKIHQTIKNLIAESKDLEMQNKELLLRLREENKNE